MQETDSDHESGDYPEPDSDYPKARKPIQYGILAVLEDGRETTGSLATRLGVTTTHIRRQLEFLRDEWGYVRYHDEDTALHELATTDTDGRTTAIDGDLAELIENHADKNDLDFDRALRNLVVTGATQTTDETDADSDTDPEPADTPREAIEQFYGNK